MLSIREMWFVLGLSVVASGGACARGEESPPAHAKTGALEATIGPLVAEPGVEKTMCRNFRLGNSETAFIHRIRAELGDSSHHMTVYLSQDTVEQPEAFECGGFDTLLQGDRPMFIAAQHRTELELPVEAGGVPVVYEIEPHQMVRIEMHYLNTTAERKSVEAKVIFESVPSSIDMLGADIAFWGTIGISIPPNSSWETDVKFVSAIPGTRSFALTTHQHHLGTRMRVWHANDTGDTAGEPVADSTDWAEPPLETYDPPLVFGTGGKAGLAYKCEWENPTQSQVTWGVSIKDEMCFFWHYYYPGRGFSYIVQP
jgi:hypothetical protein